MPRRLEVTKASWAAEAVLAYLLQDVGVQADLAFVARRGREHVGREHRAHLVPHVVIHAVGIDDAVALAEDDVAFHVDFQRLVLVLREGPLMSGCCEATVQTTSRSVDRSSVSGPPPTPGMFPCGPSGPR